MKFNKNTLFEKFLDDGEKILYVAHRHFLIFKFDSAKTIAFGLMLPALLYIIFPNFLLFAIGWGILGLLRMGYHFIDWFYDVWILTNSGIIDIERNGMFDITSTRVDYHMIEGISYNIKGLIQTIFRYGEITIDKLGAQTAVVLKDAASPKKLERKILKYQEKFVHSKSIRDHDSLKSMLSDMIAYHVQNGKIKEQ